jgi:hypothetical protein
MINECCSNEIKCNIRIKQGCHLSPTLFGNYIDKLETCLEEASCVITNIITFLRSSSELKKQLRIHKYCWCKIGDRGSQRLPTKAPL